VVVTGSGVARRQTPASGYGDQSLLDSPLEEITCESIDAFAMTIALLIALAGSFALMAVIVKRLEQA
jgi:hypothetical protein